MEMSTKNGNPKIAAMSAPSKIKNVTRWILIAFLFLVPILFIPSVFVSFQFFKTIMLFLVVIVSLFLVLLAFLKTGTVSVPSHYYFFSLLSVPVAVFLAALFSPSKITSLIGYGFEFDTFAFILAGFLLIFLVALLFKNRLSILYSYVAFLVSFSILGLVSLARIFWGNFIPFFDYLGGATVTPAGVWNNLAVMCGAATVLTLIALEMLPLRFVARWLLRAVLLLSLAILAIVNFPDVWIVLAVFSLIFFVYALSFGVATFKHQSNVGGIPSRHIAYHTLVVLIVSAIFVIAGTSLGNIISSYLNVSQTTVRPSWVSTYNIAKDTLATAPVFGAGPNRFVNQWLLHTPSGVNNSDFWATEFTSGIGYLPTFAITTGGLGILAWLLFFAALVYFGFRAIFVKTKDVLSRFTLTSSFLLTLFLWIMAILYVPSVPVLVITFFVTGLFVAAMVQEELISFKTFSVVDRPRIGFVLMLGLVLLLIVVVSVGYVMAEKFVASMYYQNGTYILNTSGDIQKAGNYLSRAVSLDANDMYLRSLAGLRVLQFNQIVNQAKQSGTTPSADTLNRDIQQTLGVALANLSAAIAYDPTKYQNWLGMESVYQQLTGIGVNNAYEEARKSFEKVAALNPNNPGVILAEAQLELVKGDTAAAKSYINQALTEKPNYTDAIFLLAQIQVSEGNVRDAIATARQAALVTPNNPGVFFQLGLLYYNEKQYIEAARAFEEAVLLDSQYANARYFLGLSYYYLNQRQSAINQFKEIKKSNPNNQEVALILKNLQNGKNPFADAAPPITNEPQNRSDLPISDQ